MMSNSRPDVVRQSVWCGALLLAIVAGGLGVRLWQLDRRVMHCDEANQAVRTGILQKTGVYQYDPREHHGPVLYYVTLPLVRLATGRDFAGTTETMFRLVPVLFGTALILMLFLLRDGLGRGAVLWGALFTAISPAMVYYSRFYIQEMLLVVFTLGAMAAGWWHVRTQKTGWALLAGVFLGLMFATKETCVIAYGAMLAGILVVYWRRDEPWPFRWKPALAGVAVAALVAVIWYSSFFTNPSGPLDSLRAFGTYLHRAGGEGAHVHPWHFYLQKLTYVRSPGGQIWGEPLIVLLAVVGSVAAWVRKDVGGIDGRLVRFLTVYTLAMTVGYSVIPYKTPWCLSSFLHGMILLAGFGAATLFGVTRNVWGKCAVGVALLAATWQLGWQMCRVNFRYPADARNPYVYAQTTPDLLNLVQRVEQLAAAHPGGRAMLVAVIGEPENVWPLPWYFRKLTQVGYWQNAAEVPVELEPVVVITTMEMAPVLPARLQLGRKMEMYGLRPGRLLVLAIPE
jgi:uncharacterized protein (TIGR03663 family)